MTPTRIIEEISYAVYAHGAWKQQLRSAIAKGSSGLSPATVSCDDQCEFGKWLNGPTISAEIRQSTPYQVVKRLHAEFHKCAGTVLEYARNQRAGEANMLLSGEFSDKSQVLIVALTKWKQELSAQKAA